MTRIFTDGAETGKAIDFFDVLGNAIADAVTFRSGLYSYSIPGSTSIKNITGISELYFRMAIRHNGGAAANFLGFYNGATLHMALRYNVLNLYEAYFSTTLVATTADPIPDTTWVLLEVRCLIADAPNGRFVVRVNGVTVIDYTGDTKNGATTTVDNIRFFGTSVTKHIDDIAMNDTAGGADNSWCGEGAVIAIKPDGNGDDSDWDGSDGDSVNNYLLVDEVPANITDYVSSATPGDIDTYAMTTFAFGGKPILRLWAMANAKSDTAPDTLNLGFKTGGVDFVDNLALGISFAAVRGPEYTQNPDTAAAWAQADIDAIQGEIDSP